MEYIKNTLEFHIDAPSVITFGKFDGLHRGHEMLMENVRRVAQENGLKTIAFTFSIPPGKQAQDTSVKVLTTNEEKRYIFEQCGIDYLIECPFTKEVMCMEPEDFISWIAKALSVKYMVAGDDFCFGHNRSGNHKILKACEEKYGYRTIVFKKMQEDHRDISSTFVREEIAAGNIKKANHLLGHPYFIYSKVVHGNQIGRKMGIPTINMALPPEKLLPKNGVYVTQTTVSGKTYKSISNIGCKPTISEDNPVGVETYILDFDGELYDQVIQVSFIDYIREERKFDSVSGLQFQIEQDIDAAREFFCSYYENITNLC